MKTIIGTMLIALVPCLGQIALAQSLFERLNPQYQDLAAPILLYDQIGTNPVTVVGFATGSIYGVPIATNRTERWASVITAKHALQNSATGKPVTGFLVKIDMKPSGGVRYLQVPLKHDTPRNYWVSPTGLDVCVIPVPPETIEGSQLVMVNEGQIVTPAVHERLHLDPGLLVETISIQPEYLDAIDFALPWNIPTVRIGHLSRIGFLTLPNGALYVRPHVIDMHSGPGNSGAAVIVHVPSKKDFSAPGFEVSNYMFLGIVMGFKEEQGAYLPYDALVTNRVKETRLDLVATDGSKTNSVAVAIKTVANPNLTYVVPVHELAEIRDSDEFKMAVALMGMNKGEYRMLSAIPAPGGGPAQPPVVGDGKPAPQP